MAENTQDSDEDSAPQPMRGRKAVRELVLQRLDDAGLKRRPRVGVDGHARMQDNLAERLAYMTPDNLQTLAETLIDAARDGCWPSELVIGQFAQALQARPPAERRIVTSWLASVEGPVAEAGGYLVELYRWLLQHPRPPMPMDMRAIRDSAIANQRQMQILAERIAPSDEERDWRERYERDRIEARRIVDDGRAARDSKTDTKDEGQAA